MPIRFRCAYCNQLMGIARRKAGTVVRCPKCAGEIIVPTPEETPSPPEGGLINPVNRTFEERGLERLLEPSATQPAPGESPAEPAAQLLGPERTFGPQALTGLFVSARSMAFAVFFVILVVGLAFAAGFFIGRAWE